MSEGPKPEPSEDRVSAITDALAGLLARVWGFEAWANCAKEAQAVQSDAESRERNSDSRGSESGPAA